MPRKATDYEKALIYKICCLDPNVKEIYVGSTTDIIRRRYNHKTACTNPNDERHNLKVYKFISQHGGWDNWKMILIEYFPCKTGLELGRREDFWKNKLKAVLNTYTPNIYETREEWCEINRERLTECSRRRWKVWEEANREEIKKKRGEKHACECGGKFTHGNKSIHLKSNKHQKHLEEKNKINKISA